MPLVTSRVRLPSLQQPQDPPAQKGPTVTTKVRRTMSSRVHEAVKAIALCHNVTPVYESNGVTDQAEAEKQYEDSCRVYQASSPDEVSPGRERFHRDALPVRPPRATGVAPEGLPGQGAPEPGSCRAAGQIHVQVRAGLGLSQSWSHGLERSLGSEPGVVWVSLGHRQRPLRRLGRCCWRLGGEARGERMASCL